MNRSTLSCRHRCQHDIVVAVATGWRIEGVLRQEPERLRKQPESAPHINSSLPELPVEDIAKLVQQGCEETTTCWRNRERGSDR